MCVYILLYCKYEGFHDHTPHTHIHIHILPYAYTVDMINIYIYKFYCGNFKYVIKYLHISRGYWLICNICGTLNRVIYVIYYISVWERTEHRDRQTERKNWWANNETPGTGVQGRLIHTDLLCTLIWVISSSFPQQKHNKKTSLIQIYKSPTQRTETHFSRRTMNLCVHIITVIIKTLPYNIFAWFLKSNATPQCLIWAFLQRSVRSWKLSYTCKVIHCILMTDEQVASPRQIKLPACIFSSQNKTKDL